MNEQMMRGMMGSQPNAAMPDERTQLMALLLRGQRPNAMPMEMMHGGLLGPMQMPQGQMPMGGLLGFGDRMTLPPIYQPPTTSGTRG